MTTAPVAIRAAFDRITVGSAVLSGIVGDAAHSFGYHLSPNDLRRRGESNDYSLTLTRDRVGSDMFPDSASALDVSMNPSDMRTVTSRLLAGAQGHDPRLSGLREFCGTLDGQNTFPWDLSTNTSEGLNSWDDSHLWHVHLSFYRNATAAEISAVMDVINGTPAEQSHSDKPPVELTESEADVLVFAYKGAMYAHDPTANSVLAFVDGTSYNRWIKSVQSVGVKTASWAPTDKQAARIVRRSH